MGGGRQRRGVKRRGGNRAKDKSRGESGRKDRREAERLDNQQVLSSFHPCGRALLSIVMGCLPSWADELMSGFNANLPNWHTARQGGPQTHTAAARLGPAAAAAGGRTRPG